MSGRVLVVDDDADVGRLLSAKLRAESREVSFAADGVSCISTARRVEPDVIILDIGMPAGDGFKTLERLRENMKLCRIPVVVYSARPASEVESQVLDAGASAFVQKTARLDELLWTVDRVLAGDWPPAG